MAVKQSLVLTLVSQDVARNESRVRVLWQSEQNNGSYNLYERTAYYYASVNGGQETRYVVEYNLPKNTVAVIEDDVITVCHDEKGAASLTVRTWMDTRISAGVVTVQQQLTLPDIPRGSSLTLEAESVVLEGADKVLTGQITPADPACRHTLTLRLEDFLQTQELAAGETGVALPVPMVLACHMPGREGTARVILDTYDGEVLMGRQEKKLTITLAADLSPYTLPQISGFSAERCGPDGTPGEDGLFVQIRGSIGFNDLGGWNGMEAAVSYRDPAGGTWQAAGAFDPAGENIYSLPDDGEYEIRLTARDRFAEVYALQMLDTGQVLMEYHAGEKRLEFKPHVSVPSLGLCDRYDNQKASLGLSAAGEAVFSLGTMLQKAFSNGFWVGNSGPIARTGPFVAQAGDSGFFIDTTAGKVYVVAGADMQNVYTGDAIARFG